MRRETGIGAQSAAATRLDAEGSDPGCGNRSDRPRERWNDDGLQRAICVLEVSAADRVMAVYAQDDAPQILTDGRSQRRTACATGVSRERRGGW